MNWQEQIKFNDVSVGDQLKPISIPITLQRLVIEAGANRDFSLIHHDGKVARETGAADAYMNTFFIGGMFERLLREWIGLRGQIRKISSLRMTNFNVIGDNVQFSGQVVATDEDDSQIELELAATTEKGQTVTARATVSLPVK